MANEFKVHILNQASFWAKRAIAVLPEHWAVGPNPDKPE